MDYESVAMKIPLVLVTPCASVDEEAHAYGQETCRLFVSDAYLRDVFQRWPELFLDLSQDSMVPLSPEQAETICAAVLRLAQELDERRTGWQIGAEIQLLEILLTLFRARDEIERGLPMNSSAPMLHPILGRQLQGSG